MALGVNCSQTVHLTDRYTGPTPSVVIMNLNRDGWKGSLVSLDRSQLLLRAVLPDANSNASVLAVCVGGNR